jgi:hypothetical protein
MKFKNLIAFSFLLIGCFLFGQSSGSITMEVTEAKSQDAQTNATLQMLIGSQTKIAFKDNKQVMDMDIMGGMMKMKMVIDNPKKERNILIDMMGQKVWTASPIEAGKSNEDSGIEVTYDKSNKKTILGYDCYGFTINMKDNPDMKLTGYLSEKIKTVENIMQGISNLKIDGTPLEYSLVSKDISMKLVAKEAANKLGDESLLNFNSDGYTKMTSEEFKQLLGPAADMFKF